MNVHCNKRKFRLGLWKTSICDKDIEVLKEIEKVLKPSFLEVFYKCAINIVVLAFGYQREN